MPRQALKVLEVAEMGDEDFSVRKPRQIQLVEDRWANVRHVVEAVAIVAAGLNLSIAVHRLGRDAHHDILVVSTSYRNIGKTEIDIAGDGFDLWGIRYGSRARYRSSDVSGKVNISSDIPERTRTLVKASMELRGAAIGGRNNRHIIMEPDDTVTIDEPVVLPRGAYESLEALVIAFPIKTSARDKCALRSCANRMVGYGCEAPETSTKTTIAPTSH